MRAPPNVPGVALLEILRRTVRRSSVGRPRIASNPPVIPAPAYAPAQFTGHAVGEGMRHVLTVENFTSRDTAVEKLTDKWEETGDIMTAPCRPECCETSLADK